MLSVNLAPWPSNSWQTAKKFKTHVQTSKNGAANGKPTGDSGLSYAGLVKVITIINGIWILERVSEEKRLKTIKSLLFINLKLQIPKSRQERGKILHITPHSLDSPARKMTSGFCPSG